MEQNFYRDEFEQMLRDTTDDFRMYPPRKVWHSIYNNFHPDRKWPSLAVTLILLAAILYIGITNNNSINKERNILSDNISTKSLLAQNQLLYQPANEAVRRNQDTKIPYTAPETAVAIELNEAPVDQNLYAAISVSNSVESSLTSTFTPTNASNVLEQKNIATNAHPADGYSTQNNLSIASPDYQQRPATTSKKNINISSNAGNVVIKENEHFAQNSVTDIDLAKVSSNKTTVDLLLSKTQIDEKAWIEDYAFHNKRNNDKWKNKLSMHFYITPSVGYRTRFKNNDFEPSFGLLQRPSPGTNAEVITQQAALNIEAGSAVIKEMSKRWRLKAGIQFNYSNYITYAHKLQHPGQTTVLQNNLNSGGLMPVSYSSNYGNVLGENESQLNNSSVQLSIPIGVDYKLMGNGKVNWYAGASLQPGFILDGNAYLVSTDYKHFAEDRSLLRSFNVNSSLETFVSIKAPSGTMINLGPQLRYQLMSTHTKQYTYTEKLYNIGFKIGITKKL